MKLWAMSYSEVHFVKSVRIRSYSGPYSIRMPTNTDQKDSEYGHFSRSGSYWDFFSFFVFQFQRKYVVLVADKLMVKSFYFHDTKKKKK